MWESHSRSEVPQLNSLSRRILTINLTRVSLSCWTSFDMSRAYRRSLLLPIHQHDDRSQAWVLQEQWLRLYHMEYLPSFITVVDMISHNQQFLRQIKLLWDHLALINSFFGLISQKFLDLRVLVLKVQVSGSGARRCLYWDHDELYFADKLHLMTRIVERWFSAPHFLWESEN